jgi:hypothetical protein
VITCSLIWLVASLLFSVLASIKMHAPNDGLGGGAHLRPRRRNRIKARCSTDFSPRPNRDRALVVRPNGRTFLILPNAAVVVEFFGTSESWRVLVGSWRAA